MFNLKDTPLKHSRSKLFILLSFAAETRARESKYKWNLNIWIWKQFSSQLSFPSLFFSLSQSSWLAARNKKRGETFWRRSKKKTFVLARKNQQYGWEIFFLWNLFIKFTVLNWHTHTTRLWVEWSDWTRKNLFIPPSNQFYLLTLREGMIYFNSKYMHTISYAGMRRVVIFHKFNFNLF
jgi:hypothetical protein